MSDQEKQDKQKQGIKGIKARVYRAIKNPPTSSRSFATWVDTTAATLSKQVACRKDGFVAYVEQFRPLNEAEQQTILRMKTKNPVLGRHAELSQITNEELVRLQTYRFRVYLIQSCLVSYRATQGGFTICNVLLEGRLFSGCSHCIKSDRWLPIRGKMQAFRRAVEQSEGVELSGADKLGVREIQERDSPVSSMPESDPVVDAWGFITSLECIVRNIYKGPGASYALLKLSEIGMWFEQHFPEKK